MQVLVVGAGAIGSAMAEEAVRLGHAVDVTDLDATRGQALAKAVRGRFVTDQDQALRGAELVIEAASGEAVRQWTVPALSAGADVLVLSVGAFADAAFLDEVRAAAAEWKGRVLVPSGAMAGIDAVKALAGEPGATCTLTTRKPPRGLKVDVTEATTVFEGDYRAAVAAFPKNINVAAALALAGIEPTVRIVADPAVDRNTHDVVIETRRHRIEVRIASEPSTANPATSDLAVRSAIALLRDLDARLRVGT